jgi:hypothetical protein
MMRLAFLAPGVSLGQPTLASRKFNVVIDLFAGQVDFRPIRRDRSIQIVVLTLSAVTFLATAVPTLRITRIDPAKTLRESRGRACLRMHPSSLQLGTALIFFGQ